MAATRYEQLIAAARDHLSARRKQGTSYHNDTFWNDEELLSIATRGTTDLWAALVDLHEEHYLTVDATNVTLAADSSTLSGVPSDCFRVYLIEPRDTTSSGTARDVIFVPKDYNHIEFINARALDAVDPTTSGVIFYAVTGQGAPNGAPTIRVAPQISSALDLAFSYIPTLGVGSYELQTASPIPGEADNALIAWIVAYAIGKERQDKLPDPGWLSIYATEKQSLCMRNAPRQEQEPVVVDGMFDNYWRSR